MHFLPQLLVFLVVFTFVIAYFAVSMVKNKVKDSLDPREDDLWKCGLFYVNVDV